MPFSKSDPVETAGAESRRDRLDRSGPTTVVLPHEGLEFLLLRILGVDIAVHEGSRTSAAQPKKKWQAATAPKKPAMSPARQAKSA